ncbi:MULTISPECIES: hypothetical protein [Methylomonas]|uniref:hypothetical protein n=1 Tax=Methylomonas TaxID=416 RepID=UPI000B0DA945|nr:hypothetical protein [Methylomonas koyamae]
MGYEVHITRKAEWFEEEGPEITIEEWKNYVVSDPEMRPKRDGFFNPVANVSNQV